MCTECVHAPSELENVYRRNLDSNLERRPPGTTSAQLARKEKKRSKTIYIYIFCLVMLQLGNQ